MITKTYCWWKNILQLCIENWKHTCLQKNLWLDTAWLLWKKEFLNAYENCNALRNALLVTKNWESFDIYVCARNTRNNAFIYLLTNLCAVWWHLDYRPYVNNDKWITTKMFSQQAIQLSCRAELFFFCWDISVICPIILLKFAVTVSTMLRQLAFLSRAVGELVRRNLRNVLTIFRLEPDPYESAHQLDCSFLLPTATANGTGR